MEQTELLWRGLRARAEIAVVQPAELPAQLEDGGDPRDGERVVAAGECCAAITADSSKDSRPYVLVVSRQPMRKAGCRITLLCFSN
jgi:hypothetical protein